MKNLNVCSVVGRVNVYDEDNVFLETFVKIKDENGRVWAGGIYEEDSFKFIHKNNGLWEDIWDSEEGDEDYILVKV